MPIRGLSLCLEGCLVVFDDLADSAVLKPRRN